MSSASDRSMRDDYAKRGGPAKAKSHRCSHNDGLVRVSPIAEIILASAADDFRRPAAASVSEEGFFSWRRPVSLPNATPLPVAPINRAVTVLPRINPA
jgi:hypothetical protein